MSYGVSTCDHRWNVVALRVLPTLFLAVAFCGGGARFAAAAPAFQDVTQTAGLDFIGSYGPTFDGLSNAERYLQLNLGNGAAVGDYDGDGDLDVYLLGQLGHSNVLYRNDLNLGVKSFTDVTTEAGVGNLGLSRVAHFVDLNNDGHLDLVLLNDNDGSEANYPPSAVYQNNGDHTFTDVTAGSGFTPVGFVRCGMALADYDQDGLLDIYVTNWSQEFGTGHPGFPYGNLLYRNLGNFEFEDVTASSGLGTLARDSFSAIFTDFNGDRFPDIYVAIDHTADEFYWNNNGVFGSGADTFANHVGNDMGAACADIDDDDDLDIYTTNITDTDEIPPMFGDGLYNCFYLNLDKSPDPKPPPLGYTLFEDVAVSRGVEDTYWGWGVEFIDVENDADLDIMAVTGYDQVVEARMQGTSAIYQTPMVLFVNNSSGYFTRNDAPGLEPTDDSRALIAFDYDRDGDEDLLITNVDQPVRLLENVTTPQGHWLDVQLVQGPGANRNAIGASVYATIGSVTKRRDIICGDSYMAGTPPEVHFGLGSVTLLDELRVRWTDGTESTYEDVQVDRLVRISQIPGDCIASPLLDTLGLDQDADGVNNCDDQCPGTPSSEQVDAFGCSCDQLDDDVDGVDNCDDQCPGTPRGEQANGDGCSCSQLDEDGDGVNNCDDQCSETLSGEQVDAQGCSCNQSDEDGDGVGDCDDQCPGTSSGEQVDADGCACSQLDEDVDGIDDCDDQCPGTLSGVQVDAQGCSCNQLDEDGDGVGDCDDQCPSTPSGEQVDADGCACSQLDEDGDSVDDCEDQCPGTPQGESVDNRGCSCSQLDDIAPEITNCPDTLTITLDADCHITVPQFSSEVAVSDNCTAAEDLIFATEPDDFDSLVPGENQVVVHVTDESGNSSNCTVTVVIEAGDCTDPVPDTVPDAASDTLQDTDTTCGDGLCATGAGGMLPLMVLGLFGMKRRMRRPRSKRCRKA